MPCGTLYGLNPFCFLEFANSGYHYYYYYCYVKLKSSIVSWYVTCSKSKSNNVLWYIIIVNPSLIFIIVLWCILVNICVQAVKSKANIDEDKEREEHTYLADYYQMNCKNVSYLLFDLPYHLIQAGLNNRYENSELMQNKYSI